MPKVKTASRSKSRRLASTTEVGPAGRKLVIVESPAKARTLLRILGPTYNIKASLGHVRDLPKASIGVDVDNGFVPEYVIPPQKRKTVAEIKAAAGSAASIYLATDPDREGEAISWHLVQAAKLDKDAMPIHRVVFHEISGEAVQQAFRSPRTIDMNLVNAQQARRILDRLVGYKLSPLLWRKVQRGLSAGRVQSVAVKMIVDREQEIKSFVPQEYWVIEVVLAPSQRETEGFRAKLVALADGSTLDIASKEQADKTTTDLEDAEYEVKSTQIKQATRQPAPPFITSTLQQEAWHKLRFTAARTMAIAQQLYEGLPIGEEGSIGLITYMRTDSTNVSASAVNEARELIREKYGARFLPSKPRAFAKRTKWAQEAHEAIRPTSIHRQPGGLKQFLNPAQLRLYELIWNRMVASQMSAAVYDTTNIDIEARIVGRAKNRPRGYLFRASSSTLRFPGFMAVYSEDHDDNGRRDGYVALPDLKVGDRLTLLTILPEQCFTQPPPAYTEATLIKALEQKGIGRPSTYAPIISTILDREYVTKADGRFHPTELGFAVNKILSEHFPRIVDLGFTARMEEQLDLIAQGKYEWIAALHEFYPPFQESVNMASTNVDRVTVTQMTDESCPNCDRPMVIKVGRFGKFLACSGYPDCKTTKPYMIKTGVHCPECGSEVVERISKKKRIFYGCSSYPQCRFAINRRPVAQPCPQCGKLMIQYREGWARCLTCQHKVALSDVETHPAQKAKRTC
jgi:DNA topoisomerase I